MIDLRLFFLILHASLLLVMTERDTSMFQASVELRI